MLSLSRAARHRTAISHTLALAVAVVGLAGCGGSSDNGIASRNASEILAAAKAAAQSATAVHVEAHNAQGPLTLTVKLELTSNGGHAHITGLGLDFEVIRIHNTVYVKGNPILYQRLGGPAAHAPPGTWVKAPANSGPLAQYAAFTDLPGEVGRLLSSANPVTKGAIVVANGQKTIVLKQTGRLYTGQIRIATTGKPYPIEITKTGRETGRTTFSNWNQPVSLSVPSKTISIG
jgi:hypothetical protein